MVRRNAKKRRNPAFLKASSAPSIIEQREAANLAINELAEGKIHAASDRANYIGKDL